MTHRVGKLRQARSAGRWRAFGDLLQRRQAVVVRIQWAFAALYAFLLVGPAVLPPPAAQAGVFDSLARFSEALFWGIWWPAVLLATLVLGQFWCGVLCPDGMLTEFASRHGRGARIPRWLRRPGWPMLGFALLISYEQLTDAYRSPLATLVLLGGCSVAGDRLRCADRPQQARLVPLPVPAGQRLCLAFALRGTPFSRRPPSLGQCAASPVGGGRLPAAARRAPPEQQRKVHYVRALQRSLQCRRTRAAWPG